MSMGFLCICVYDLHLKKVNIKENCKWSIYAPHMSELPHLNFHFEFVINLIYSINQINLYGSYNEDTLGLFSIRLIFTPINSYGLYMRYYEKWSEIARADSTTNFYTSLVIPCFSLYLSFWFFLNISFYGLKTSKK